MKPPLLRVDDRLNILGFGWRALRRCSGHQRIHELQRGFRRFGHLVFQLPGGVVRKAKQFGFLGAKLSQTGDGFARIVRPAAFGAIPGVLEERLASGAMAERIQIGLLRGVLQRNDVAVQLALLGGLRGGGNLRIAQARQRVLILGDVSRILGGGEQLGGEGVGESGLLFVELLQFGLVGIREVGAGVHKFLVVELDQAQRFRIELQRIALLVDRVHALEQLGVEKDRVLMRGQPGRLEVLHFLQLGIQVRSGDAVECGHHAVEQLAGLFHGDKRVLERRRGGIVGDRPYFLALLRHAGFNRGLVIAVLDLVERRRLKGQRARRIERIIRSKSHIDIRGGGAGAERQDTGHN